MKWISVVWSGWYLAVPGISLDSSEQKLGVFRFYSAVVSAGSWRQQQQILRWLGAESWALWGSILSQHGVKLSNFSWAVWSEIIYRFLLLRHCILLSWKSLILIIYQNKINPKQILNIPGRSEVRLVGSLNCRHSWPYWVSPPAVWPWTHVYIVYTLWSGYCQARNNKTQRIKRCIYDLDSCHNYG